jgi:L-asparaginase
MMKKVVFLGTGGTIAGTAKSESDNVGYKAAQVGIDKLLESSPALRWTLGAHLAETEQVLQVNSKDMVFAGWQLLLARIVHHLARPEVASVLITHGTDTLEETAYFLHRVIPAHLLSEKAVVLTCAMRPASSANADGPANLCDATAVAVSSLRSGVMVVCAGTVHAGLHIQKVHPYRLDPFDSGDAGPLGFVEEGKFRRVTALVQDSHGTTELNIARVSTIRCPRVEVIVSHSGSDGAIVRALVKDPLNETEPLRGIVVAGAGNGAIHEAMEVALKQAQQAGILVWRTTRCAYGEVVPGNGVETDEFPFTSTSAVKARIDMLLTLC